MIIFRGSDHKDQPQAMLALLLLLLCPTSAPAQEDVNPFENLPTISPAGPVEGAPKVSSDELTDFFSDDEAPGEDQLFGADEEPEEDELFGADEAPGDDDELFGADEEPVADDEELFGEDEDLFGGEEAAATEKPVFCYQAGEKHAEGTEWAFSGFQFKCIKGYKTGVATKIHCILPDGSTLSSDDAQKKIGSDTFICAGSGNDMSLRTIGEDGTEKSIYDRPPDLLQAEADCRLGQCNMRKPTAKPYCKIKGDPHLITFDGRKNSYQGTCRTTAVQPAEGTEPHFRVSLKAEHRRSKRQKGGLRVSYLRWVEVLAYGQVIRFSVGGVFTVNKRKASAPFFFPQTAPGAQCDADKACQMTVMPKGRKGYVLTTAFGLAVSYDGKHRAYISLDEEVYGSKVRGMCGNFDGDKENDFAMANGTQTDSYNFVGDSWIEEEDETEETCTRFEEKETETICEPNLEKGAEELCAKILDPSGPFKDCLAKFPEVLESAHRDCLFDVCAYELDEDVRCTAVESVAETCQRELDKEIRWRTADYCPLPCPDEMTYSPCMQPVAPTCTLPDPDALGLNNQSCIEGCKCAEGKFLDGDHCIGKSDCGCLDETGAYQEKDTMWVSNDCGQECTCKGEGIVECTTHKCPEDMDCVPDEQTGVLGCECEEGYLKDGDTCIEITTTPEPTTTPTTTTTTTTPTTTPEPTTTTTTTTPKPTTTTTTTTPKPTTTTTTPKPTTTTTTPKPTTTTTTPKPTTTTTTPKPTTTTTTPKPTTTTTTTTPKPTTTTTPKPTTTTTTSTPTPARPVADVPVQKTTPEPLPATTRKATTPEECGQGERFAYGKCTCMAGYRRTPGGACARAQCPLC